MLIYNGGVVSSVTKALVYSIRLLLFVLTLPSYTEHKKRRPEPTGSWLLRAPGSLAHLYSFQMTALRPSSWPARPAPPTESWVTRGRSLPVVVSRDTMAMLHDVWPPKATKSPALLIWKVRG